MKLKIVFGDGIPVTLDDVESFTIVEEECHTSDVAQRPTVGKLFEVKPLEIDRNIFRTPMAPWKYADWKRELILQAFAEVDKNPEKYSSVFHTLIPEKNWKGEKSIEELKKYSKELGGETADWVEQALEWAQRISNGETWEDICSNADTVKWCRMIQWNTKNVNSVRFVGGSIHQVHNFDASRINESSYCTTKLLDHAVPLVVFRKQH